MGFIQQGFIDQGFPGDGGGPVIDADAEAFAARATSMDDVHIRRLSEAIQMLKGLPGNWEQLSSDYWTGKVKGFWPMMGDYQLMPAAKGDSFVSFFDVRGLKDLAVTGISGANRGSRFTGTNYATSSGAVLTTSPLWAIWIGNCNVGLASQQLAMGQTDGSSTGRTSLINFGSTGGSQLSFYGDGVSEQAASAVSDLSNDPRIFAMRNTGAGGASDLTLYADGSAVPRGTPDFGRTYSVLSTNFTMGRVQGGATPFTGYGILGMVGQGSITEEDLARIGRNLNSIMRLGVRGGGFERPLPNGEPVSQFALQAASGTTTTSYLGSPSVIRCNDELVALHDTFGTSTLRNTAYCFASSDDGLTWTLRATITSFQWMRLFRLPSDAANVIYALGTTGENGLPVIKRSLNSGATWSSTTLIGAGSFHTGNVNIIFKGGFALAAFEEITTGTRPNATFVFKADMSADLMSSASWVRSNVVGAATYDPIFGTDLATGKEVFENNMIEYPNGSLGVIGRVSFMGEKAAKWTYDLATNTLTPVAGLINLVAGWCKFHILRCPTTGKYLLFGNQKPGDVTDDRTLMKVWKSTDGVAWTEAGTIVDLGVHNYQEEGDSYPYPQFDGNNILLVSRLAYNGANDYHNTNRGIFRIIPSYINLYGL